MYCTHSIYHVVYFHTHTHIQKDTNTQARKPALTCLIFAAASKNTSENKL